MHLDVKDKTWWCCGTSLRISAKNVHGGLTEHSQLITKAINAGITARKPSL